MIMDYPYTEKKTRNDGLQRLFRFKNGFGASAICHSGSLGGSQGLWELAFLDKKGHVTYFNEISKEPVIGYLSWEAVAPWLDRVADLPENHHNQSFWR